MDEWRGFALFVRPLTTLPPAPLAFGVFWLALLTTPFALAHSFRQRFRAHEKTTQPAAGTTASDLSVVALAIVGLLAPFVAVRFLWLILFPLLLGADRLHALSSDRGANPFAAAIAALSLTLVPLYWIGAERAAVPSNARTKNFAAAFDADRYSAHAVWFLADSEVEGKLFHPYFMGGFLDYWLAPKTQTFIDGSLNVPPNVLADYGRYQSPAFENRETVLDTYEIDFFVGVGFPLEPLKGRPWRYTTNDLAHTNSWMLVFRNLRSAVYMRRHSRNAENLARITAYYERAGIPFSETQGLDVSLVLESAPAWAVEHGVAPHDFLPLRRAALGQGQRLRPALRARARDRLATTYAVLDLCEKALTLDRSAIRQQSQETDTAGTNRAPSRHRRIKACQARLANPTSTRITWLTPIEAGRIRGVQRKPPTRMRTRSGTDRTLKDYSGSQ